MSDTTYRRVNLRCARHNCRIDFASALQYASLFFIVGVGVDKDDENELGVLEFIHCLVETLDKVWLVHACDKQSILLL